MTASASAVEAALAWLLERHAVVRFHETDDVAGDWPSIGIGVVLSDGIDRIRSVHYLPENQPLLTGLVAAVAQAQQEHAEAEQVLAAFNRLVQDAGGWDTPADGWDTA